MSENNSANIHDNSDAVSISFDSISVLLQSKVLDPPVRPGLIANIESFDVIEIIGYGSMGIVFKACSPISNDIVAIKVLRPEFVDKPRAVRRFLSEAKHMQRLSHPNILPVLEISERPVGPYFVMPYITSGSLVHRIKPGIPLDYKLTFDIARQIADALAYAHSKGIIHRDLKPGNVLLDNKGQAYLTDFGLVRTVFNDTIVDPQQSHCEGTAPYMSPAVAAGQAEDTRCDIYSFGAMLYEMLTGHLPYDGRNSHEILQKILAGPPVPILKLNPKAPLELVEIVEGTMAREVRDRYAQMADVLTDIERAMRGEKPVGPHGNIRAGKRTYRHIVVTLLIGLLIAISAIAVLWKFMPEYYPQSIKSSSQSDKVPAGIGKYTVLSTLLNDDFIGNKINSKLWRWNQTHEYSYQGLGWHQFQVSQANGSLLLDARAAHDRGWTARQDVWLDSKVNLKQKENVLIKVEFSGSARNGYINILLTDGQKPHGLNDPDGIVLFSRKGNKNHPLTIGRTILYARLCPQTDSILIAVKDK